MIMEFVGMKKRTVSDMEDKYIKLSDAKNALADYIAEQTVSKYGYLEACREARFGVEGAMKELDYVPTADVAPKSEVERLNKELDELAEEHSDLIVEKDELFDIAEKRQVEIEALKIANEKMYSAIEATKVEVAREIFEEIERNIINSNFEFMFVNKKYFAELKKKYTEDA